MPLMFTGSSGSSFQLERLLEAFDGDTRVIVITSQEAIDHHGLGSIQSRASEKYDAGLLEEDGRVRVFTTDL